MSFVLSDFVFCQGFLAFTGYKLLSHVNFFEAGVLSHIIAIEKHLSPIIALI